jgi:hypothetical protein
MALDPPGEHHEQQLKRLKRWGHYSGVYGLTNRRGSSSSRLAHCPIASFEFLDTTPSRNSPRYGRATSTPLSTSGLNRIDGWSQTAWWELHSAVYPLRAVAICRSLFRERRQRTDIFVNSR